MAKIIVQNTNITIITVNGEDYVSITDLARHKSDDPTGGYRKLDAQPEYH